MVNLFYVGVFTGGASVSNFGAQFGGEAGVRVKHNLDIIAELGWFQDAVNDHTIAAADPIVNYLTSTQGKPAGATVKAPTTFATIGGRWVFENEGKIRPYFVVELGGARVEKKSTFTLNGTDITSSLPAYGVTLGQDLTGHSSHFAFTGGGGILMPLGMLYLDAGYRLTSISTIDAGSGASVGPWLWDSVYAAANTPGSTTGVVSVAGVANAAPAAV